ncbi:MAG: 50S ribosomal protein L15 [Bacteroidetes bacterium GWE2_29_8]|nr:MAG: 50S ribosomal protein L15 [Bacteroidetes bacterium GWE2_29_8]OFY21206.1 MAG: 50S ribosomal protein L15 [Bacteroidetes bacterium GWF2_29_10]
MNLSTLKPAEGSVETAKRIARGEGSGKGGTSTRGYNGAQSRAGYSRKFGFEGGQMPIQRRLPKYGFKPINRVEYTPINLDVIQNLVDKFNLTVLDKETFVKHGLVSNKDLIKILGRGKIEAQIEIHANKFSEQAKNKIETIGGKTIQL